MFYRYLFIIVLLIFISCGGEKGSQWLMKTKEQTITVNEAGEIWNNLTPSTRASYLANINTVGTFISTLGKETIIFSEVNNTNYLNSIDMANLKNCWIRHASVNAFKDSLSSSYRDEITNTDITNYQQLLGKIVWYSVNHNETFGPVRLPDLPWDLAFAFDTITAGTSIELEGIEYTLDSSSTSRNLLNNEMQHETTFAISNLTQSRVNRHLNTLKAPLLQQLFIDSLSIELYTKQDASLNNSTTLAFWQDDTISAEELNVALSFITPKISASVSSSDWVYAALINQAGLFILEDIYSNQYPADYTKIQSQANDYAVDMVTDMLFTENITNTIIITDSMVVEAYTEITSAGETRSFQNMEQSLRANILIHCEEQRTMEWICELEEKWDLEINNNILGDIPSDPSQWSSF